MKKYDFYLAGPFFNDDQLNMQERIELMFKMHSKKCFSPRLDAGTLSKDANKKDMYDVFMEDLKAIKHSKILFANISYRDTGTSVEIGYALAKGIPVVLFWNKYKHDTEHVNLMLAMACDGNVIQNWTELGDYLDTNILPNADEYFNFDVE